MKKSNVFWIILAVLALVLIVNLIYRFVYFTNFNKDMRPATDAEKQKAIESLNKTINVDSYQIEFKNVFASKHGEVIGIVLTNSNVRLDYFVDLANGRVWKR
jgi:hypothetical protein